MDDHELERAREWDDSLADVPKPQDQPRSQWTTVGARGKQPKKETQGPPPKASPFSNVRRTAANPSPRASPAPRQNYRPIAGGSRPPPPRFSPQKRTPRPQNPSRARPQAPRRPLPRFVENADNEAQYAWRERKPPTDAVRIPAVMVHADRSMNDTPTYLQLAIDCGAFVYSDELKSESM